MSEPKKQSRPKKSKQERVFESESINLQSLRLIAAPNPADDLSEAELEELGRQNRYPADMIQHIINYVKSL